MAIRDDLGTRMKKYYEEIPKIKLMRRCPTVIRIDGCHFHTFTRGFRKPFDRVLMDSMQQTMKYLCENIQGCVFGYTQSDEISLILVDYRRFNSEAWFNNEVQKMCSVSASMATMVFNKFFEQNYDDWGRKNFPDWDEGGTNEKIEEWLININNAYFKTSDKGATFDSRCFNIPKEEVANLIYWRQLDATRNSIEMVGHCNF